MKRFQITQSVLALSNPKDKGGQKRTKGQIYSVKNITFCTCCGVQLINIGGESLETGNIKCSCGCPLYNHGLSWTLSKHFAPLNEKTLNMLENKEDYELAVVVRDYLSKEHQQPLIQSIH